MIEIINRQRKHRVRTRAFERLLRRLLLRHRAGNPEITLAFVGERAIRTLNRRFMNKDKPTDVLSFPLRKNGADGRFYLGDIVIAVPLAFRQSRENGTSLERELARLTVHGFLHLLGYDHSAKMEKEERIAGRLDLP
jgi:probable rRNA maturation factor